MKRRMPLLSSIVAALVAAGGLYWYLSRPQLVFLGFPGSYIALMMKASSETGVKYEFWGRHQMEDPKLNPASLLRYKAIFVSGRRSEPLSDPLKRAIFAAQNKGIKVIVLPPDQAKSLGVGNADFSGAEQPIERYFHYGGTENMAGLFQYAAKTYLGKNVVPPPPVATPESGYYHPESPRKFVRTSDYAAWYEQSKRVKPDGPRVLIDFADGWKLGSTAGTDAIIAAFEKKGWNTAAIFGRQNTAQYALEWKPDILITRTHGRWYQGERGVQLLASRLDIPLLRGLQLFLTGETLSDYRKTKAGIRGAGLAIGAIVPELDGAIEPTLLEGLDAEWYGKRYEAILDDRIDRLTDRAMRWVRLRKTPNAAKKIAVIYVAGVGKGKVVAAGLNVPNSMIRFLRGLKDAGYGVSQLPSSPEALIQEMNTKGRNVAESQLGDMEELSRMSGVELLPASEYIAWFEQLPESLRKQVTDAFGPPPGRLMVIQRDGKEFILIPKLEFGNVVVMPQPARGGRYDAKLLHNDKIPPPHQFLAAYWWIEKKFKADAIVNYGTHGTHEFLPGRPVGQLSDDWSDVTLGRLPNIYVYIMDNVGEALIAKRRGSAVVVSHQTPPVVASSLAEADPLVGEIYRSTQQFATQEDGALKEKLREQIRDLAVAKKFDRDLNKDWSRTLPTDEDVQALELHIHLLDEERIPLGLHTHGRANSEEELAPVITEVLGAEFQKNAGGRKRAVALVREMLKAPVEAAPPARLGHPDAGGRSLIFEANGTNQSQASGPSRPNTAAAQAIPSFDTAARVRALKAAFAGTANEIPETLRALEGRYIRPGGGGDVVRNPMALPTGKNLYGVNPQEAPTRAAWELGKKLADDLIAAEQKRLGRFPRKIGFTLWNTELIRHYGADLAQILYLMGLKPRWNEQGIVQGVDVIPMSELKRPRIDVVIQAASLFRDTFPDRMEFLDQAVRIASELRDGENYLAENNELNERQLKELGLSAKDARVLARARVFSNAPGGYGTGVIDGIEKSGSYENSKPITEDYLSKTGAVYTAGVEWGKSVPKLYEQQLKSTDAVALSRSSNVVSALTLDHYFEYLGGMTMAIRDTTGKSPETYVTDVRDASRASMLTAQQALRNDMRTKYWNPKWISAQQKEGFSGAAEIAETTKNLFGWQVTKPEAIGDDVWDTVEQIYVADSLKLGIREWFDEKNPYAYQSTTAILLESARKGYWNPSQEVLERVANEYAQSVARHGHAGDSRTTDNTAFQAFLLKQLNAPGNLSGIQLSKSYQQSLDKSSGIAGKLLVAGQLLVREAVSPKTQNLVRHSTSIAAGLLMLATLFYFGVRRRIRR
jgi:cobaltochelatase CobN